MWDKLYHNPIVACRKNLFLDSEKRILFAIHKGGIKRYGDPRNSFGLSQSKSGCLKVHRLSKEIQP